MIDIVIIFITILVQSACAMAIAFAFLMSSSSDRDVLYFIPAYIERRWGAGSKLYQLIRCPKCLAGQVAFWSGLPALPVFGPYFFIATVAFAIIGAKIISNKYGSDLR